VKARSLWKVAKALAQSKYALKRVSWSMPASCWNSLDSIWAVSVPRAALNPWRQSWNFTLAVTRELMMHSRTFKTTSKRPMPLCWKMCASTTMVSLKFPLQDPLQAVATSSNNHTTIISSELNCFIRQAGLFLMLSQHSLEIIPSEYHWVIKKRRLDRRVYGRSIGFVPKRLRRDRLHADGTCR